MKKHPARDADASARRAGTSIQELEQAHLPHKGARHAPLILRESMKA